MAVAEPDPLIVTGGQLQIGAELGNSHGQHHHAARVCPGLQPTHCTTAETTNPLADQDHIEPVDHRRQHVDPRRVAGDHHQPLQRHPHVGGGSDTQLGESGHPDPCPFTRWRRGERQGQ
jgi:hypothetical protein